MCTAKAAALSALVTLEKQESREREKQRKAFILVSPNLLQLYVRVQARTGGGKGVGERIASAMAVHSMVAFFRFCQAHTSSAHIAATRGFPPGVPKRSNSTHQRLITPVPKDRRETCTGCFHGDALRDLDHYRCYPDEFCTLSLKLCVSLWSSVYLFYLGFNPTMKLYNFFVYIFLWVFATVVFSLCVFCD